MKLKDVLKKLKGPTKVCKICFKSNSSVSLRNVLSNSCLCNECSRTFIPTFERFKVQEIPALAIFTYDDVFKNLIYQFKGCYDYELKNVFLDKFYRELSLFFKGYTMVPAPSSEADDKKREFNHVEEIFLKLKLPMEKLFYKEGAFKQADHNFKERKNIKNHIKLIKENIEDKKYLLVDDIYTTGATMNSMVDLLKKKGVKKMKILVLCKTKMKDLI